MEQQTFEGTWEEILQYAPELAGQRVRLTVLSPETPQSEQRVTLDQTLQGKVTVSRLNEAIGICEPYVL